MGGLVANGGARIGGESPVVAVITNDGFWPDIDLGDLRSSTRLTGNVTDERLKASAIEAMLDINGKLAVFRAGKIGEGWDSAQDVGESIAGATQIVHRYRRAVYSTVQADMAEKSRNWDNTRAGDMRAETEDNSADDFRRNAEWAVADILGRPRNVIELL